MPSNAGFSASATASGTQTFSFTNTAGTVLYLTVGNGVASTGTVTYGTVSYGGVSMTKVLEQTTSGSTTGGKIAIYRLLTPATGANTVSIAFTLSGTVGTAVIWAGCISLTGNNTSTPEVQSTSATGNSTTPSVSLSGVAAGNISIGGAGAGTSMNAQTQTLSWAANVNDLTAMGNGRSTRSASSGTVAHSFTIAGTDSWVTLMVEIAAAATSVPSTNVFRSTVPFMSNGRI